MGSMAASIYVQPEDLYAALRLFGVSLVVRLPWLLIKGYLRGRKTREPRT
jgi:hypothetical protein